MCPRLRNRQRASRIGVSEMAFKDKRKADNLRYCGIVNALIRLRMSRPDTTPEHVTPYDRLTWTDVEVERLLASGEQHPELAAYFGEQEYRELARLAVEARKAPLRRDGARVYLVPGIMGSQLGLRRRAPLPDDILWIDPVDIIFGRLTVLSLPGSAAIVPLGVVLYTYLKLKLLLRAQGFDAVFHQYDWRLGVDELGRDFAQRLRNESASTIMLVAHSMGGLISRAALNLPGTEKVRRVVLLGTPNSGSFAPVQALRGTYAVVRKVARLDLRHSAEELADEVFSTFPSLYHLLPDPRYSGETDLFDAAQWPDEGPRPRIELLESARAIERMLAPPDERFTVVVGVDQETVTSVARENGEFVYTVTRHGDGTVPTACAVLPGARTYFTPVAHAELTRNRKVVEAVADILRTGSTRRLAPDWVRGGLAEARISDSELRRTHPGKVDWTGLEPEERRIFLQTLNDPPKLRLQPPAAPRPARVPKKKGARTAARKTPARAQKLEIRIEVGDIAKAPADAVVVAVFQDVRPAGALAAIDKHLDGLIAEFASRRMLPGEAGNVITVPTHKKLPRAEHVLLAGIGRFDKLNSRTIEFTAENVARLCVRSGIETFATVLWGNGANFPAEESCESQLRGYLRGLAATDAEQAVKKIIFCVRDRTRHKQLISACRRVLTTDRLPGREIVLREPAARSRSKKTAARKPVQTVAPTTTYLLVNEQPGMDGASSLRAAVLTAGLQAAVIAESQHFSPGALEERLGELESRGLTAEQLRKFGEDLAALTLHQTVREGLHATRRRPLVVVHDAAASRIPWEALCINGWFPAAQAGLSRRYAAEQLSLARFSETRREREDLAVLLVADPNGDLPGAEQEREQLTALLRPVRNARLTIVNGKAATRSRLLAELQSGAHDVVHFAGHALFDAQVPARGGIRCSDGVLSGPELAELTQLPALVVFNACESARLRGEKPERLPGCHGLAEVFLRAGVANYIGTHWPVRDSAALSFSKSFYSSLLRRSSLGTAVVRARSAMRERGTMDWADYIHYGDPDFRLKE